MTGDEFDLRRFPFEAKRAIESTGDVLLDQLEPGLLAEPDDDADEVVLRVRDGREVGRIPRGRLRSIDPERLRSELARRADIDSNSRRALVVLATTPERIEDDPTREWVVVPTGEHQWIGIHRSQLVEGWPDERADPEMELWWR